MLLLGSFLQTLGPSSRTGGTISWPSSRLLEITFTWPSLRNDPLHEHSHKNDTIVNCVLLSSWFYDNEWYTLNRVPWSYRYRCYLHVCCLTLLLTSFLHYISFIILRLINMVPAVPSLFYFFLFCCCDAFKHFGFPLVKAKNFNYVQIGVNGGNQFTSNTAECCSKSYRTSKFIKLQRSWLITRSDFWQFTGNSSDFELKKSGWFRVSAE